VLINIGPGREDSACSHRDISLPHISIGAKSRNSERFWTSGNERTSANFSEWGATDAGYKLKPTDKFAGIVELMNQNIEDKVVWLTMTYTIVDGHPYKDDIRVVWYDVRQVRNRYSLDDYSRRCANFSRVWHLRSQSTKGEE
jgi:hypothetical protein